MTNQKIYAKIQTKNQAFFELSVREVKGLTKKEFYDEWIKQFCKDVPQSLINRHILKKGNFLWHLFSWELLPDNRYLSGEKANEAFDLVSKQGALYIEGIDYQRSKDMNEEVHQIIPEMETADCLSQFWEVYVVGKNFKWTYIKTHEDGLGPYFMKR